MRLGGRVKNFTPTPNLYSPLFLFCFKSSVRFLSLQSLVLCVIVWTLKDPIPAEAHVYVAMSAVYKRPLGLFVACFGLVFIGLAAYFSRKSWQRCQLANERDVGD